MIRIHYSLDKVKEIVEELMPPKNNHLIGDFKLEFLISSKNWDYTSEELEMKTQRGFSYFIKKASLAQEIIFLTDCLDEHYEYSDDHKYWISQIDIRKRIKKLEDENQVWLLQELSKGLARF